MTSHICILATYSAATKSTGGLKLNLHHSEPHSATPTPEPNTDRSSNSAIATSEASSNQQRTIRSNTIDMFPTILGLLKVFKFITKELANVRASIFILCLADLRAELHPYAKVALCVFTWASKMILDQRDHGDTVSHIVSKVAPISSSISQTRRVSAKDLTRMSPTNQILRFRAGDMGMGWCLRTTADGISQVYESVTIYIAVPVSISSTAADQWARV
ncbi:uncharacterized protein EDB93DRAFT_1254517 [Suillus bovinus]|uniref:uncharacterized protein n=1 Tax=Suillus bovinus TaxID=48563 RepID=UPI001B85C2DB|nr:uncharacterized protein EDB93DRAFT_1254517 [Suillus bovinus]KAG2134397.1 hypothetical protein EDB93DRAFT_1254517 [Suillus bovinus]